MSQDEGVFGAIGQGIVDGKVPYSDFFDHKSPLIYFVYSIFAWLTPRQFVPLQILGFSTLILTGILTYFISEKVKKGTGIFAFPLFLLSAFFYEGKYFLTESLAVLFVSAATLSYLKYKSDNNWTKIFLVGIFASLAVISKQTAIINFFILLIIASGEISKKSMLQLSLGASVPAFLFLIYFSVNSAVWVAVEMIIGVNLTQYPPESISLVLQWVGKYILYTLPLWLLFFHALLGGSFNITKNRIIFLFAIGPIPFFFFRHYPHYWLQVLPFVCIIAGVAVKSFSRWLLYASLSVSLVSFCWFVRASWEDVPRWREETEAARFIRQSNRSFVAENQFTGFYFLSGSQPLSKYIYLTEINESEGAQERVLESLKVNPSLLVVWPKNEEFAYAKELQRFILEKYSAVRVYEKLGLVIYKANGQ